MYLKLHLMLYLLNPHFPHHFFLYLSNLHLHLPDIFFSPHRLHSYRIQFTLFIAQTGIFLIIQMFIIFTVLVQLHYHWRLSKSVVKHEI